MKNVMIVTKQGNTVAVGEGFNKICQSGTGAFMSNLKAIKEVLLQVPVEPCETVNIHIMDTVQGLASGSAIEYVKSGKTLSGSTLTGEEINLFKEIYKLYAERILNVRFSLVKYIKRDNASLQALKKQAYDELDAYERTVGVSRGTAVTVDPDKELRETFDAQIKDAMLAKDMALVKDLMELRKALREPEVVKATNNTVERPDFGFNTENSNKSLEDELDVDSTDSPIQFNLEEQGIKEF